MQFKLITTLAVFPLSSLTINHTAFSSTASCSGAAFGYRQWRTLLRWQARRTWLLSCLIISQWKAGQGYSSGAPCSDVIFNVFGPGTKCWNGGRGSRAAYMNWFYSPGGRRGARSVSCCEELRSVVLVLQAHRQPGISRFPVVRRDAEDCW